MKANQLRVLIGCEKSGVVRREFRKLGHEAFSCDLRPADDCGEHIICDHELHLLDIVDSGNWDLFIVHPPCTYLCVSGMHWTTRGLRDPALTLQALQFVRALLGAKCPRISLENPIGCISTRIRKPDQIIQPWQFGDDASKATCLWLKGLPKLIPTRCVAPRIVGGRKRWANQTDSGQNRLGPSEERADIRAQTYPGIAAAMAEQWSKAIVEANVPELIRRKTERAA